MKNLVFIALLAFISCSDDYSLENSNLDSLNTSIENEALDVGALTLKTFENEVASERKVIGGGIYCASKCSIEQYDCLAYARSFFSEYNLCIETLAECDDFPLGWPKPALCDNVSATICQQIYDEVIFNHGAEIHAEEVKCRKVYDSCMKDCKGGGIVDEL